MNEAREVFTIGHSTHPEERFLGLLRSHGIEVLCDVRRFPGSRRMPQFNARRLEESLGSAGIEYVQLGEELGGRRRASKVPEPTVAGWRVDAFRGYAEYMRTDEFARGLERLESLAVTRRVAYMCAEGDWRRCHRRLVSDALVARGWRVVHIKPDGSTDDHELTLFATVSGEQIDYPAEED